MWISDTAFYVKSNTGNKIPGWTSGLLIAKSISIKDRGCRSGRCAVKAVELTFTDSIRRADAVHKEMRVEPEGTQRELVINWLKINKFEVRVPRALKKENVRLLAGIRTKEVRLSSS